MFNLTTLGWKRGAAIGLALAVGLLVSVADQGQSKDPPAKLEIPNNPTDKPKTDDAKAKPDDSTKDEPKVMAPSGGSPQTAAGSSRQGWTSRASRECAPPPPA